MPVVPGRLLATLALALAVALVLGSGCGREAAAPARPLVAVSVAPHAFLVERIGGAHVGVAVMLPPGANPATWEPTVRQLQALGRASLYVKVGHPHFAFERAWLDALLAERPELRVVDASQGLISHAGDPHVWVAPAQGAVAARTLAGALVDLLPEAAAEIESNLAALLRELEAVDGELRERLGSRRGARFWVFHPAWGYLAEAYGLEQVAIEQDGKEPDARRLAALIERARAERVRTLFVQPQFDRSPAEVVARAIGAHLEVLDPLAADWLANLRAVGAALEQGAVP